MEVLSNWLARLTVNQVSPEHVGSNPTSSTEEKVKMIVKNHLRKKNA